MKVIQASYEILTDLSDPIKILKDIERAGRVCYKSENNITDDSCITFCKNIINREHEAEDTEECVNRRLEAKISKLERLTFGNRRFRR